MNAEDLFARDDEKRKKAGWSAMAFIAPTYPAPTTDAEKVAFDVLDLDHKTGNYRGRKEGPYQLHVYSVLELLQAAYLAGLKAGSK